MAASVYDIVIIKNTDFEVTFTFSDENGDPIDHDDYSFEAELRPTPGDSSVPIEFTVAKLSPTTGGKVTLSLTDTVTGNLALSKYYYDVVGDDDEGDGTRTVFIGGRITVLPAVSRTWA